MNKLLKVILWIIAIILLIAGIIYFRPAWTPRIKSEKDEHSVASLEKITIGNLKQTVLIRTKNINNPIILFIHGGPGMPLMYLSYKFQRPLESYFTVVQWDQRGAGKSYDPKIPIQSINVEQYISDAQQLIDTLRNRYHQQKIFIVGHSWGTYLASILATRYPELFYAYISVGQVVDDEKEKKIQREFLWSEAKKNNDAALITNLENPDFKSFESWLFKYGGELKHSKNYIPFIITGIFSPEYTFKDVINVAKGPQFCNKHMRYNAIQGSILDNLTKYDIPVYFLTGVHDYTTPSPLIKQYFDSIQAPKKEIIWFKESAHFPFFEEPKKFDSILIEHILTSTPVQPKYSPR